MMNYCNHLEIYLLYFKLRMYVIHNLDLVYKHVLFVDLQSIHIDPFYLHEILKQLSPANDLILTATHCAQNLIDFHIERFRTNESIRRNRFGASFSTARKGK